MPEMTRNALVVLDIIMVVVVVVVDTAENGRVHTISIMDVSANQHVVYGAESQPMPRHKRISAFAHAWQDGSKQPHRELCTIGMWQWWRSIFIHISHHSAVKGQYVGFNARLCVCVWGRRWNGCRSFGNGSVVFGTNRQGIQTFPRGKRRYYMLNFILWYTINITVQMPCAWGVSYRALCPQCVCVSFATKTCLRICIKCVRQAGGDPTPSTSHFVHIRG